MFFFLLRESVIRLCLGSKLLGNLLQVVNQTDQYPPNSLTNKWRRRQTMGFSGRGFKSHIHHEYVNFSDFTMSNLINTLSGIPRK